MQDLEDLDGPAVRKPRASLLVLGSASFRILPRPPKLMELPRQDPHGLVVMLGPGVLLAAFGSPPPLLELFGVGVVGQVQPVEHLPKMGMMGPHALQGGVQLVVALGLREPPGG